MNKRKISLLIASIVITILLMIIPNKVAAVTTHIPPLYFGVKEFRDGTSPQNLAYAIRNPYDNGSTTASMVGAKIWQIVKYNSNIDRTYTTGNYYCVRAGVGFSDVTNIAPYTISYDLKAERNVIAMYGNNTLKKIINNGYFNNLLALTDLVYLKGESSIAERTALLEAAGIYADNYEYLLTDSDIEAVQQAAMWYFTNHDDATFSQIYDNFGLNKTSWLFYRTLEMSQKGEKYTSLSDYNLGRNEFGGQSGEGLDRQEQAVLLYNYLINTANVNAITYANGTAVSRTKVTLYANATQENTQPIILIEKKQEIPGNYGIVLVKQDAEGRQLNSQATFEINGVRRNIIGTLQIASNVQINASNVSKADTYIIKELIAPDEYCKFDGIITVTVTKTIENGTYKVDNISYRVTDSNGNDITNNTKDSVNVYLNEDGNIYVEVKNYQNNGKYNVVLVKQDEKGEQLNSSARFEVNQKIIDVTGRLQIASNVEINSSNVSKPDTYIIKELIAPDKYCKFDGIITVTVNKKNENGTFKLDNISYKVTDENGKDITNNTKDLLNVYLNQDGNIYVEVKNYQFDLKLIKRIVEINGVKVTERIEDVDITNLKNGTATTAKYTLNKTPLVVKNGDIIKYTLRVYNEGAVDGYASEITEDIPVGLELLWSEKTGDELEQDTTLSALEKEAIRYNQLIWNFKRVNSTTNKPELISTDYLAKGKGQEIANDGANLIKAFDSSKEYKNTINDKNPDYKEVSVYLKVAASNDISKIIRNEAAITGDTDKDGNQVTDRDSKPEDWVKYEDDEDYDNVILESFDLSLRKFIIAVSKDTTIQDNEYLKDSKGAYTRAPIVDTSKLNTIGADGKKITTAIYNHTKIPVEVAKKDIVVYMIRVYNEGDIDGYASEITDHLPPYLEYVDSEFNKKYGWEVSENGRTVKTAYLDNHLISKTTTNSKGEIVLSYKEVPIMCQVTDKAEGKITNIADITVSKDKNKQLVEDRDSEERNVVLPEDSKLPTYKDDEKGTYIPGQEDDDDFEKLIVKKFDLALRKFITEVTGKEVTTRIPKVNYNSETKKITYEHTKEPVDVTTGDVVVYTIRVYNEGEINGFASEITDDIPDGLSYLPENELNKKYKWIMYDKDGKKTEDISKAVKIKTDYLSKEVSGEDALLKAFDGTKEISDSNPDYADVKVAFKVVEPTTSDRVIINAAQISDDTDEDGKPVDDEDSIPDEWNEGEDDQDKEYVKLNYFDLALRKWVTQAIVIEDGKEVITQTGHKPEDDPEQVVKVEIHRKKINSVIVKFKYSIRVTNEGDIAGYAKEITDYVPQGLKFEQADNKEWKDEGNNVISTRALENKLLQPGESAEVEVVLTWINGKDNMGLKVNVAEISEDYNDKDVPDKDSVPDNQIPGEDDQDDAPVLITVSTGQTRIYYTLGFVILITIAGGIVLIKKFVL